MRTDLAKDAPETSPAVAEALPQDSQNPKFHKIRWNSNKTPKSEKGVGKKLLDTWGVARLAYY